MQCQPKVSVDMKCDMVEGSGGGFPRLRCDSSCVCPVVEAGEERSRAP